jgi:hypothetical protein
MSRLAYTAAGLVAGAVLASTGTALSAWLISGKGEASVQLASLKPLGVSPAKIAGAWPGDTIDVHADLSNPNERQVSVTGITLTDLSSDTAGCATGLKFVPSTDISLAPGDSHDVLVGTVTIPKGIAQKCAGANVTGDLAVEAGYAS